jgi:hypothetical protein
VPIEPLDPRTGGGVFDFLDRVAAPRGREHWEWKYRAPTGEPAAFYWVEPDGRVLGFIGLMRTTLTASAQQHAAAWFVDWHVIPGDRGVGVGLGLLRKAEAAAGTLLTLQGSADTQRILPRLGWKQSLSAMTWTLPLSARFIAALAARRVPGWLRAVAHVAGTASAYFHCTQPATPADVALVDTQRLPPEYDRVWEARALEFGPAMRRDSTYINALCADYPDGGFRLQMLTCGPTTVGHLVSRLDSDRRGFRRGRIVDLMWPRADAALAAWLVRAASWQLQEAGADYVECVLSVPELRASLRQRRFRPRGSVPLWYHRLPPAVSEPERWFISFLDCDRAYR